MSGAADALDPAAGDWLFAQACAFERGVTALDQLPPADRPEIAFAGRSNVGKSSLLNALTGRTHLARVSNTPGRTQQLNFFSLPADKIGLYLVDLPGYGYAKAPKRDAARWNDLMIRYLRGRASLKRVFVLIDARHGIKSADEPLFGDFDANAISYQVVLTKTDKLGAGALEPLQDATLERLRAHVAAHPRIVCTSSVTGAGISLLRAEIAALIDVLALGYNGAVASRGVAQ
jgi:GTP-binding protein